MEENIENIQLNPKYIRGVKGWLVIFILTLIFIGVNLLRATIEELFDYRRDFFHLRIEIQMVNFALMFAGMFFPFFVAFRLYKKKNHSVLITKIFLVLLPFYSFAWSIFKSSTMPYDIGYAIILGLFIVGGLYTLPWLFYLNYSKRVSNTYLFTGKYLPKDVQCPYCLEVIELENDKQLIQDFECASCNRIISRNNL